MVSHSISFRVAVWARDHLNRAPYTHELKQDAGWLAQRSSELLEQP